MKAEFWHSILLCQVRQKAKPKHAVTPEHVEGDAEVADPKHLRVFICRLQVVGCQNCQLALANHTMSLLALFSDGASAVKQMLPYSITDSIW